MRLSKPSDSLRSGIERAEKFKAKPKRALRLPKRSGDPYALLISFLALTISFAGFVTSNAYRRTSVGVLFQAGDIHATEIDDEYEQYIRLIFVNNGSVPVIVREVAGGLWNGTVGDKGRDVARLTDFGEVKDRSFVLKPGESADATRKFRATFNGFTELGPRTEFHTLRELYDEWSKVRLYPELYVRIVIPDVGETMTEIDEGTYALPDSMLSASELDRPQDVSIKKRTIERDWSTHQSDPAWKYFSLYDNYAFFNRVREAFARLASLL